LDAGGLDTWRRPASSPGPTSRPVSNTAGLVP
jgi:hypothetical protein